MLAHAAEDNSIGRSSHISSDSLKYCAAPDGLPHIGKTERDSYRQPRLGSYARGKGHYRRKLVLCAGLALLSLISLQSGNAGANLSSEDTPSEIVIGASRIEVQVTPGDLSLNRAAVLAWVRHSATAVAKYFGHFPVSRAVVRVHPFTGRGLGFATTDSEGERAAIEIPVGNATTQADLDKDWVLTHEMVHMAFPLVYRRDHWLVEGMATYIEPLARMQAGYISSESIWGDLVNGLPQGLPARGDRGLDDTDSWGRTYWGGAMYCLLADLEIRKATNNKKGLQNALQAIDSTGGSIISDMEVLDALRLGDKSIGTKQPILESLYNKMKSEPISPDLNRLWKELGVKKQGKLITFDQSAPLAHVRRAIESGL